MYLIALLATLQAKPMKVIERGDTLMLLNIPDSMWVIGEHIPKPDTLKLIVKQDSVVAAVGYDLGEPLPRSLVRTLRKLAIKEP